MAAGWTCVRDGACCTIPAEVVVTPEEAQAMIAHPRAAGIDARWQVRSDGLIALQARPCPFYQQKACVVYDTRPYNCRRFMCGRRDVQAEAFTENPVPMILADRGLRRTARRLQDKAQRWARTHGWRDRA